MPNTLAHLAVNGLLTRRLVRGAELPWIYAGCVIPDLPWVFQRAVKALGSGVDPYDLRLYAVNQASLFISLVLCAGLAALAASWRRTFAILGVGCLLHLLLDACQIKWANGVSLFVPFDWRLVRFDLFWPESWLTYALTLGGLSYFVATLRTAAGQMLCWSTQPARWCAGLILIALYFVLPALWCPQAMTADNHFVATLRSVENREGKRLELDRAGYHGNPEGPKLVTFAGESLHVAGIEGLRNAKVSLRGQFIASDTVNVRDYHVHRTGPRDFASYVGLALVGGLWIWCAWRSPRPAVKPTLKTS